jgi:flavin-binding protein dodecin
MTIARVTEIIASSNKSFEDAIEKGINRASKTLKNVEGAWVKEQRWSLRTARSQSIASTSRSPSF